MFVYVTSPWVPREWIYAHGLEPRGVWLDRDLGIPASPLRAGACAFSQSMISLAETHPADLVIFTTHCDQMRRSFDMAATQRPQNLFLFNLPATSGTGTDRRMYRDELARLSRFLIRAGGHEAKELELLATRQQTAQRRVLDWSRRAGGRAGAETSARFLHGNAEPAQNPPAPASRRLTPVALVGGPLPQSQWPVFDTLEQAGAHVTVNGTENGERAMETGDAPAPFDLDSLAESCAQRCVDVFQRPNTRLYAWMKQRFTEGSVRGIVLWSYVNCDLWRAETANLRETFELPVLALEAHETLADATRARTRIEAFLEALE